MHDSASSIPRRLNDAPRMFWWDLDLALLVLASALLGMVAGYFVSGIAAGVVTAWAYGRMKSGKHPAYALHLIYWHLPNAVVRLKCTPPSHFRDLVG